MSEEGKDGQADPQCYPDLHGEREGEHEERRTGAPEFLIFTDSFLLPAAQSPDHSASNFSHGIPVLFTLQPQPGPRRLWPGTLHLPLTQALQSPLTQLLRDSPDRKILSAQRPFLPGNLP